MTWPDTDLDYIILRLDSSTRYVMYPIESISISQSKDSTSIALPGQAPSDNIQMQLSGMSREYDINFKIWDDGVDRQKLVGESNIISVDDQLEHILETLHDPSGTAGWTISEATGKYSYLKNEDVILGNINPDIKGRESAKWISCRMTLIVGKSIA